MTVWAAMSCYGLLSIAVIDGTMDSENYVQVPNWCLLPFASEECPTDWIYQQDTAPYYVSNAKMQFLSESNVDVLPWPAQCLDLNIIENLLDIIVCDV